MESMARQVDSADRDHPPRISVIIPAYNRGGLLIEALESVFRQTWTDFEVIVVDDGSTDDTAALIAPFLSRICFLRQSNRGVAAARNLGIRHARGEFICFLDSDDLWMTTKLEEQIAFAEQNAQYALIATEIEAFDESGEVSDRRKSKMYRIHNGFVLEHLLFSNWIQSSTVMVRRSVLLSVGGFDEDVGNFGEDWLLWMRFAAVAQIYFLPKPLVRYRIHTQNLTCHRPESQYRSLMRILDKLALLPEFEARPNLIRRARYRIALIRGSADIHKLAYNRAIEKLRPASAAVRFPVRAWILLGRTYAMRWLNGRTGRFGSSQNAAAED